MFLCLIVLYLLVFVACAINAGSREGYWSPVIVFGITAFYYYLSLPLELYLRGDEVFTTYPGIFKVSPEVRVAIAVSAILALLGFVAGHKLSGLGRFIATSDLPQASKLPASLKYVAIGSVVLLALLYRFTIFEKLTYEDANERRFNDPGFSYLTRLCLQMGCLTAGVIVQRKGFARAPALIFAMLAIAWGFYTSDKNPLLKAALGLSAFWVGKQSRSLKHLYLYCGAGVVAIAALPLFSAFRANAPLDIYGSITEFSVQNTDAKGPMISLVLAFEQDIPKLYGSSYVYSLVAWIPRAIWPNRPDDFAQEFALDNIPNWRPGMGLGYSLLAEAHLNFGYTGAFLQYFGIAFALGRIWGALYNLLARQGADLYWRAILVVTYFEIIAIMHRLPSSYILQSSIFELLMPMGAFYWFDARRMRKQTNLRPPQGVLARNELRRRQLPRSAANTN